MWAQVDGQGQDPVVDAPDGVADDGVVLKVDPGLVHEALSVRPLQRWNTTLAHGPGPGPEPFDHGFYVEIVGYGRHLTRERDRPTWGVPRQRREERYNVPPVTISSCSTVSCFSASTNGSPRVKKGRHRRFEEARALKRLNEEIVEPCAECGAEPGAEHASWCRAMEELDDEEYSDSEPYRA